MRTRRPASLERGLSEAPETPQREVVPKRPRFPHLRHVVEPPKHERPLRVDDDPGDLLAQPLFPFIEGGLELRRAIDDHAAATGLAVDGPGLEVEAVIGQEVSPPQPGHSSSSTSTALTAYSCKWSLPASSTGWEETKVVTS